METQKPTLMLKKKPMETIIFTPKPSPKMRQIDMRTIALKNALKTKINPLQSELT